MPRLRRKPRCVQRTAAKARVSLMSIRWVWATVSGSSAQIWMSRSPPVHRGSSRSMEAGQRRPATRAGASSPAAANSPGPNPNVTVSRAGRTASSGSVSASAGSPLGEPGGVVGEQPHHPAERARSTPRQQVEGDERGVRLGRGVDAGLVEAVERPPSRCRARGGAAGVAGTGVGRGDARRRRR